MGFFRTSKRLFAELEKKKLRGILNEDELLKKSKKISQIKKIKFI
jgi:hypothetical protein